MREIVVTMNRKRLLTKTKLTMEEKTASTKEIIIRGLIGGAIAAVMNIAIFLISKLTEISFELPAMKEGADPVSLKTSAILIASVIPSIAAILLMLLLKRLSKHHLRSFTLISTGLLIVSFFPLTIDIPNSTRVILGIMHIVAAASIVFSLRSAFKTSEI